MQNDDVLDAAVQSMLRAAAATSPPEDLVAQIEAAGPVGEVPRPRLFWPVWARRPLRPLLRCAAAAVLLLLLWQTAEYLLRPGLAFADVAKRLQQTHSVFFRMTMTIDEKPAVINYTLAEPGLMRIQMGAPANTILTFDESRSTGLLLLSDEKKAIALTTAADVPKETASAIAWYRSLRQAQDHSVQDLGPRKIGDKTTFGFRVKKKTAQDLNVWTDYDVWVDRRTALPVQAETSIKVGEIKAGVVLDNFVFDADVPPTLFSLTPPAGYTVVAKTELTMPTESDLVFMLRMTADLNSKVFPDDVSLKTLQQIYMQQSKSKWPGQKRPTGPDFAAVMKMTNGLTFIHLRQADSDWRYLGKGVRLGDASRIVCAWRKKGERDFRVVLGDLRIRNASEAELTEKRKP
jgi:outer membrane lipoprotein-sorting protein